MTKAKIAITIDSDLLRNVDRLVSEGMFKHRSSAIEDAVRDRLSRIERRRLARECAKLDPEFERRLAEEGLEDEGAEWPEY